MSSYGLLLGERQEWLGLSSVEALAMLGIIIVFPSITKRVIVSDRCGESTGTNQLPKLFDSNSWIGTQTTTSIPPFRTPFAAHFWYQWRWKGFGLLYSMLWLCVIGGLAIALNHRGRGVWSDILTELLALTSVGFVFICGIYGFVLGANVDLWMVDRSRRERAQPRRSDAIGSFIGSQPISDQSLARVLLAVCTGAVAMAVVPWLLLCITTRWYSNDDIEVNHFWYSLLVLVALWWMAASNVMTVVCTGRSLTRWTLLVVGVLVVLAMAYRGPIENLLWIIFALTVLLLSACAVASFRKRFIGVKTLAAISGFLIAQIPVNGWFATGQPDGWIWVTSIAALWCVLPIVAMPLAIEMNRHR
jgi:hypothetical protein